LWRHVRAGGALERPEAERHAFLAEACDGDERLRQKLAS
jgi:hypothetical protein